LEALDERKRAILGAVVEGHIAAGEPVSSAWVSESADLGICSATVRGEMSELERMGYLDHPHTSAGRVPTDRGYRVYVEVLMSEAEPARAPGLLADLGGTREVEPALADTCRALARLTRYLSLAQPPSWGSERLRHMQLARLEGRRALAVIVTESGRVHHALLEFGRLPSAAQMRALAMVINHRFAGEALSDLTKDRLESVVRDLWPRRSFAEKAVRVLAASMPAADDSPLVTEGGSRLLEAREFQQAAIARQVFGLIEDGTYLRSLLSRQRPGLSVTIGGEADHPAMRHCALVSATFEAPGGSTGHIGILGPKRMRYRPAMAALLLATSNLGAALAGR